MREVRCQRRFPGSRQHDRLIVLIGAQFNADATAPQLLPAVEALGISVNGNNPVEAIEAAAKHVYDLIGQMGLPQRLRDAGVKEDDLPRLARLGFQNRTIQNNPKPIIDAAQIERLLREAW